MVGVGEPPLLLQWELTHAVVCALLREHRGAALAITLLHAIIIATYSLSVHAVESERDAIDLRISLSCASAAAVCGSNYFSYSPAAVNWSLVRSIAACLCFRRQEMKKNSVYNSPFGFIGDL
jgi:hypothetical protein